MENYFVHETALGKHPVELQQREKFLQIQYDLSKIKMPTKSKKNSFRPHMNWAPHALHGDLGSSSQRARRRLQHKKSKIWILITRLHCKLKLVSIHALRDHRRYRQRTILSTSRHKMGRANRKHNTPVFVIIFILSFLHFCIFLF